MESKKEKSLVELANEVAEAKGDRNKLAALQNYAQALDHAKDSPDRPAASRNSLVRDLNDVNSQIESIEKNLVGTRPRAAGSDPTPKPNSLVEKENATRKVQTLPRSVKDKWNKFADKLKGTESTEGKVQDVSKAVEQTLSQQGPPQPSKVAEPKFNSPKLSFKMGAGRGGAR